MICPRCSVAEISAETHTCVLCGYSPGGVTLEVGARDALDEAAHRELADQFHIEATHAEGPGPSLSYAARETAADRPVTLGVFRRSTTRDTRFDERFQRDMTAAAALDHPHIVPLYRFGTTKTLFWYATKPVEGRTLGHLLAEKGRLDVLVCLRLVEQMASALQAAHRRGVVHGDFRPAQVMLDEDWALVTGFAVGRLLAELDERAEAGAARYTAPEAASLRQPVPASDQYALAVTVYECLTGEAPRAEQPGADEAAAEPPANLPATVWAALRRALERDPARRFPSVSDFVHALSTTEVQRPPVGPVPSLPPEARATQRVLLMDRYRSPGARRRVLIGIAVVAGLFLLIDLLQPAAGPPVTPTVVIPGPQTPTPPPTTATPSPPLADPAEPVPTTGRPGGRPAVRPGTPPVAAEMALLFINTTPWGEVYVDDQLVGTTPQAALPVTPGAHRLRVVREGYQPWEREVSVAPGQQLRLTNIVLEAEQP